MACLAALDIEIANNTMPKELPTAIPFEQDTVHACYDTGAVDRWWRILAASAQVTAKHRSWFVGKASPVHFFWGSFDLTATRHNGEPTPIAPPTTPRPP